jgi:hypothetical protein
MDKEGRRQGKNMKQKTIQISMTIESSLLVDSAAFYNSLRPRGAVTQHGCLPSLLGGGHKGIEIVYGEETIFSILGRLEQPRQNKNILYQHEKPNQPTK